MMTLAKHKRLIMLCRFLVDLEVITNHMFFDFAFTDVIT